MGCDHTTVFGNVEKEGNKVTANISSIAAAQEKQFIALEAQLNAILTILSAKGILQATAAESDAEGNDWNDCDATTWMDAIGKKVISRANGGVNGLNISFDARMDSLNGVVNNILKAIGNGKS